MPNPLLQTKLYIPSTRANLVPRMLLVQKLNSGVGEEQTVFPRKLSLISAPAGFGKTTLVTEWLAQQDRPVAWVALDEDDSEPQQFFRYLALAVQEIVGVGQSLLGILKSPQAISAKSLVMAFINDVTSASTPFLFILDDYHLIQSAEIDQSMAFLLDHMPPQMHLVLTIRRDPGFPLSRLRVQGQMTEIRAEDLRFTVAETSAFLEQVMGLSLESEQIAALEERTEGWIAGLQMAALSMQNHDDIASFVDNFTGSNRFVIDYLTDEVLQQIPPELQDFLLQTSILARLSVPLCAAVISEYENEGRDAELIHNVQQNLETLERANLFLIPLDDNRIWYRYHHLFADLLQKRLQQQRADQVDELHQRACRWYEENGQITDALYHARAMADFERATELITAHIREAIAQGNSRMGFAWLNAMPDKYIRAHPLLAIGKAWSFIYTAQFAQCESYLVSAESSLKQGGYDTTAQNMQGEILAIRAIAARYMGQSDGVAALCRQALAQLSSENVLGRALILYALAGALREEEKTQEAISICLDGLQPSAESGQTFLVMILTTQLYEMYVECGHLRDAKRLLQQTIEMHRGRAALPAVAMLHVGLGALAYEWNDLDEATTQLGTAISHSQIELVSVLSHIHSAQVNLAQGDTAVAESMLARAEDTLHHQPLDVISSQFSGFLARIALWRGDVAKARNWQQASGLQASGLHPSLLPTYAHEFQLLVLARLFIAEGRLKPSATFFDDALTLLAGIAEQAAAAGRFGCVMEAQILQALAYDALANPTEATQLLQQALILAEAEGYVRSFVDEGEPMAVLLRRLEGHPYAARLLTAFPDAMSSAPSPQHNSSLVEPLSTRELEVLRLMADGLKYQEIADQLIVSLNTVRSHTKNIYGKLGVNNRTQAIGKAHELNLL